MMSQAQTLLELQRCDLAMLRIQKQIDNLPQKEKILELRARKADVMHKAEQVAELRATSESEIERFTQEDTMLADKINTLQAKLDATKDYRVTTSLTKEIAGAKRRREKIEFEHIAQLERQEKIETVAKQVAETKRQLENAERDQIASYREEGIGLQKNIADQKVQRDAAVALLPAELVARYEKLRASRGGIGVEEFNGVRCSVCNVELNEGDRIRLQRAVGLETCPSCGRMLVLGSSRES